MNKLKKVTSSYRIMKILKLLYQKPRSIDEICFELDADNIGVKKETITKYFSTLRNCGCTVEKRSGKFYLINMPFCINLNQKELETLAYFHKFSQKFNSNLFEEETYSLLSKILKLTNIETHTKYHKILNRTKIQDFIFEKDILKKVSVISNYIEEKSKIKIKYKEENHTIIPKNLLYSKGKFYLKAFFEEENKYKNINISNIEDFVEIGRNRGLTNFTSTTVFKIKDRLAVGYYPYEKEIVQIENNSTKIISNKTQDKNALLKRILKYGVLCEIISPKTEKELFLNSINEMIKNFENPNCY